METALQEVDALAKFRGIAPEKQSMSDRAAEKLQAIGRQDKTTTAANAKFAAQFAHLHMNTGVIVRLLKKIYRADQNAWTVEVSYNNNDCVVTPVRKTPLMSDALLERMANKALWCLRHGWKVSERHDLTFFGTLTAEEMKMNDEKFVAHLERTAPTNPTSLARYDGEGLKPEFRTGAPTKTAIVPSGKRCALRSKCMKAENRVAAYVPGNGKYCSTMCQGRAKAFAKAGTVVSEAD